MFTKAEVLNLLLGKGLLTDNKNKTYAGSFVWKCKDSAENPVEIVVLFNEATQVASVEIKRFVATAISAWRETP